MQNRDQLRLVSYFFVYLSRKKEKNMNKRTFKDWFIATRPWSFPASAMPIIVSIAYLF